MLEETKKQPAFLRYQEQSMLRFKDDEPDEGAETRKFWLFCVPVEYLEDHKCTSAGLTTKQEA